MNGKTLTLTAVAASLLLSTAASGAYAQGHGDRRGPGRGGPEVRFVQMLQLADTNKDGKISKEEATAAGTTLFTSIDGDKDGVLTPGEMRQHREAMREEQKAAREAMRAERKAEREAAQADAPDQQAMNGNGKGSDGKGHDGKRHGGKHHGWHGDRADRGERGEHGKRGAARMMRIADTDENGQISQAEATAMVDKMFTRMDRNKDGVISADDMPKRPMMLR